MSLSGVGQRFDFGGLFFAADVVGVHRLERDLRRGRLVLDQFGNRIGFELQLELRQAIGLHHAQVGALRLRRGAWRAGTFQQRLRIDVGDFESDRIGCRSCSDAAAPQALRAARAGRCGGAARRACRGLRGLGRRHRRFGGNWRTGGRRGGRAAPAERPDAARAARRDGRRAGAPAGRRGGSRRAGRRRARGGGALGGGLTTRFAGGGAAAA